MELKCIVIDDEDIDRLVVTTMIKKYDHLQLLAAYDSAEAAMKSELYLQADVLFLDIDMGGISGLEFRKMATIVPACVFITSHPEFALDSYTLDTLDYVMKPLTKQRFEATVVRLNDFFEIRAKANLYENNFQGGFIFIKEGNSETKLMMHDIQYLEALKDYTRIHTASKKHYVLSSIGNLLKQKEFEPFVRIHRSYAVRKDQVKSVNYKQVILRDDTEIPIGRNFKDNIKEIYPDGV